MPPTKVQQLLEEAVELHGAGRLDRAERLYRQARTVDPRHFDVLHLSGTLALQRERFGEAAEWLARAAELNDRSAVCLMRLAIAQSGLGRFEEAEKSLRAALRRQPDLAEAWDRLGSVLKFLGRLAEAIPCHERAVALKPDFAPAWHHLGLALLEARRPVESLAAQDRALRLGPPAAGFHHGRAQALLKSYRPVEALAACDAALACEPGHGPARSLRLLLLSEGGRLTREQLRVECQAYGEAFPEFVFPASAVGNRPDRKLRVAFLAPQLPGHAIACFLEPILRHLDRSRFTVLVYHDHFAVTDGADRLRTLAEVWRNFIGLAPEAVATAIRADAPDILIDLAGHLGPNRMPLLARRLAPVQIGYLGSPESSGVAAIDYRLTDEVTDPTGETDAWHTEQLVRFASCARVYLPPAASPPVASAPPFVANGHVTFGCFNDFNRISDEVVAAWDVLLGAVPESRLRLSIPGFAQPAVAAVVRERLRRLEVAADRLELLDDPPGAGLHLARFHGVDIALDTFPGSGTIATCEALWMGVPVVSLAGGHPASRLGASLLQALGRPEWIARDWNNYVQIAAALAENPAGLRSLRGTLRAELQRSPLFDYQAQAGRFGPALHECWQARCRSYAAVAVA